MHRKIIPRVNVYIHIVTPIIYRYNIINVRIRRWQKRLVKMGRG